MFDRAHDAKVCQTAFAWLGEQVEHHGDVLPRNVLAQGFLLEGIRTPLVGPQGIFKPQAPCAKFCSRSTRPRKAHTMTRLAKTGCCATAIAAPAGIIPTIGDCAPPWSIACLSSTSTGWRAAATSRRGRSLSSTTIREGGFSPWQSMTARIWASLTATASARWRWMGSRILHAGHPCLQWLVNHAGPSLAFRVLEGGHGRRLQFC